MEALLASANLEATGYDDDFDIDFESDEDNNKNSNKSLSNQETSDVLKNAAKIVAKEDKELSEKVFIEAANDIKALLPSNEKELSGLDILIQSSEEVHKKMNIIKEDVVKEPSSSVYYNSSEEDNYDDEDEIDDEIDLSLNQSLIFACYHDKIENVKALLQKPGCSYFARDRHGWTPLHWAASKGYAEVMQILLKYVQSTNKNLQRYVNAQDKISGWTALHLACIQGHISCVEILLKHKAKKSKPNYLKEIPEDCVGKSKYTKAILKLLGVQINSETHSNEHTQHESKTENENRIRRGHKEAK